MKVSIFFCIVLFFVSFCDSNAQEEEFYWYKYQYSNEMISEKIRDMDVDHLGYIWVMTSSNLYFLNGQGFSRAVKFERSDSSFTHFIKNESELLAGTKEGPLTMYKANTARKNRTEKIDKKKYHQQWEYASDSIMYRIRNTEKEEIKIAPEFQLLKNPIRFGKNAKLVLHNDNEVWLFGENGLLLYKNEKRAFKARTPLNIIKNITAVRHEPEKNRTLYLTTYAGVFIQDSTGQNIRNIPIPFKYRRMIAYDWFFRENSVIIWAGYGVFELNLNTYKLDLIFDPKFINGEKIKSLYCLFATLSPDSSYLVLGVKGNLFYTYDFHTKKLSTYEIELGIKDDSNTIFEMDYLTKNRAILTTDKGIYLFDKNSRVVEKMPYLKEKLIRIGAERIQDLDVVMDNLVYFSTLNKGMFIYNIQNDSLYEPINNLKDVAKLTNFVVDDEGDAWFGSNKGILHYRKSMNRLNLFDTKNGLYTDNLQTVICHFDQGKIFFGKGSKYVYFDPDDIRKSFDSKLHIQSIKINGTPDLSTDPILGSALLELNYTENNIVFRIGGPNYGTTQQFQVETRMIGLNDQWAFSMEPERIEFQSLPPGKYKFQYKPLGKPDSSAKEISIDIRQPFWTRPWVRYGAAGLGVLLLIGLYLYNIWTIKKRAFLQAEYEKKISKIQMDALRARMNPHFIFNSLNSIKSYIIENDSRSATRYLTKFAHLIRQILNNSKESNISLQAEIRSLELYIEIEKLRFNDSFTYDIEVDTNLSIDELSIPSMILQPIVENAIWHGLLHKSGDKHVAISIKEDENFLLASIEDNGIGRARSREYKSKTVIKDKSMGTDITIERLNLESKSGENGSFEIIDLYDDEQPAGTLVKLKIPKKLLTNEDGNNKSDNN